MRVTSAVLTEGLQFASVVETTSRNVLRGDFLDQFGAEEICDARAR